MKSCRTAAGIPKMPNRLHIGPIPRYARPRNTSVKLGSTSLPCKLKLESLSNLHDHASPPRVFPTLNSAKSGVYNKSVHNFIRINIIDNWGDPNHLTISNMQLLNKNKKAIYSDAITTTTENVPDLSCLCDENLVKREDDNYFCMDWSKKKELTILLSVPSNETPFYIRIWNIKFNEETGVKNVEIKNKTTFCCSVPKGFGCDIPIAEDAARMISSSQSDDLSYKIRKPAIPEPCLIDEYGKYPFTKITNLNLKILGYRTPGCFSLYSIETYNEFNQRIEIDQIDSIVILDCFEHSDPNQLFTYKFDENSSRGCFNAEPRGKANPTIVVSFKTPTAISKICIFNIEKHVHGVDTGVSKMKILGDGKVKWIGRFPRKENNIERAFEPITIWFTEEPTIRNHHHIDSAGGFQNVSLVDKAMIISESDESDASLNDDD